MIRQETGAPGRARAWPGWEVAVNTAVPTATASDFQAAFPSYTCGRESSAKDGRLTHIWQRINSRFVLLQRASGFRCL